MKINRFILALVIASFLIGAVGCTRSKATPPPALSTQPGVQNSSTQSMGIIPLIATQTAVAAAAQKTLVPGNPTGNKTPAVPAATVAPAANNPPPAAATKVPVPVVVVPAATAGLPTTYTLQKGEFPYCIARRFNVNPAELLSINGLGSASGTFPGLVLRLPTTGNTFPDGRALHKHPATYTVNAGDTIYAIGCYYGDVDPLVIAKVNGINSPYNLTSGQSLQIP